MGGKYGTALVAAVYGKIIDMVSLLLDRGANINMVNGECGTALATAVYGGSADMVSLLLDRGADINTVGDEYGTALITAVYATVWWECGQGVAPAWPRSRGGWRRWVWDCIGCGCV